MTATSQMDTKNMIEFHKSLPDLIHNHPRFLSEIQPLLQIKDSPLELGHTHGSFIENLVSEILISDFGFTPKNTQRSFGDCYYGSDPLNIKSGFSDKCGQPNMCSIKRLMDKYVDGEITGYYILKIKISKGQIKIHCCDILDHPDCLSSDIGTGQIMLKEEKFYSKIDTDQNIPLSREKKSKNLISLYDQSFVNHMRKKEEDHKKIMEKFGHLL